MVFKRFQQIGLISQICNAISTSPRIWVLLPVMEYFDAVLVIAVLTLSSAQRP